MNYVNVHVHVVLQCTYLTLYNYYVDLLMADCFIIISIMSSWYIHFMSLVGLTLLVHSLHSSYSTCIVMTHLHIYYVQVYKIRCMAGISVDIFEVGLSVAKQENQQN